jgi:hypothetical protein
LLVVDGCFCWGFLKITVLRRGVSLVWSWCFAWLGLVPCCTFLWKLKVRHNFQIYFLGRLL